MGATAVGNAMSGLSARLGARLGALELDVTLQIDGGTTALVGPNGAGKTSVLRLLLGALRPTDGRIALDGRVLFDAKTGVDLPPEERDIGYVPQDYALFPHLDAADNVAFALGTRRRPVPRKRRRAEARAMLDSLGAGDLANRRPATLSGGERQRVALARAMAAEPRLLLLDEPLTALDVGARAEVRAILARDLELLGRPAIIVTHDPDDARVLARDIMVIEGGGITRSGPADMVVAEPGTAYTRRLFTR